MNRRSIALLFACLGLAAASRASVIWDESVNGGLSHDFATAPVPDGGPVTLLVGTAVVGLAIVRRSRGN